LLIAIPRPTIKNCVEDDVNDQDDAGGGKS
jgi:hypothetical protein